MYQITEELRENYCHIRCQWILKYFPKPTSPSRPQYAKTHDHTGRNGGQWPNRNPPAPEPEPRYSELDPIISYLAIERDALEATAYHDEIQSKGEVVARITAIGGGERGMNPGDVLRDPKRRHVDPILARYDLSS